MTTYYFPKEIMSLIYSYDNTYFNLYKKVVFELQEINNGIIDKHNLKYFNEDYGCSYTQTLNNIHGQMNILVWMDNYHADDFEEFSITTPIYILWKLGYKDFFEDLWFFDRIPL
jgi:hypothetical protein